MIASFTLFFFFFFFFTILSFFNSFCCFVESVITASWRLVKASVLGFFFLFLINRLYAFPFVFRDRVQIYASVTQTPEHLSTDKTGGGVNLISLISNAAWTFKLAGRRAQSLEQRRWRIVQIFEKFLELLPSNRSQSPEIASVNRSDAT